jgi:hypothetical protein
MPVNASEENINRKGEIVFPKIYVSPHPGDLLLDVLTQPCYSQFATSRARLHLIPLGKLSETDHSDEFTGWVYSRQSLVVSLKTWRFVG